MRWPTSCAHSARSRSCCRPSRSSRRAIPPRWIAPAPPGSVRLADPHQRQHGDDSGSDSSDSEHRSGQNHMARRRGDRPGDRVRRCRNAASRPPSCRKNTSRKPCSRRCTITPICHGARMLLPQGDRARPVLADLLRGAGAEVETVIAYENVRPEIDPALLRPFDAVTFTSSSTVQNFVELFDDPLACDRRRAGRVYRPGDRRHRARSRSARAYHRGSAHRRRADRGAGRGI